MLTHFSHVFGEIICDKAVAVGKEFRAHFRDFPAGYIGVEAVEKRRIDHRGREGG